MLVGYMRVSSVDDRQSVDLQRDALIAAGVDERHIHANKASGARDDRPGLKACLAWLKEGDTLLVWKLDRLGRSLPSYTGKPRACAASETTFAASLKPSVIRRNASTCSLGDKLAMLNMLGCSDL